MDDTLGLSCQHGQLARVCELCEAFADIERLTARVAELEAGEPNMRHPKVQALIGGMARANIERDIMRDVLAQGEAYEPTATDMEYWGPDHDKAIALHRRVAELEAEREVVGTEVHGLRNVIQAVCIGGTGAMIERWKKAFPDAPVPSVFTLACGHPHSLMLKSAETGADLYCELCDAQSGRRDAEGREAELLRDNAALREALAKGVGLMTRYRHETPLGHQPHMIAHHAEAWIEDAARRAA